MKNKKVTRDYSDKNSSSNKSKKKAFFFLRHNNDIDHIVPVLYKWLSTQDVPTDVIIYTNRDFLEDYRIKYLKQFKNVRIFYLRDLTKTFSLRYFFNVVYFKYDTQLDEIFMRNRFIKNIADKIIKNIANKIFKGVDKGIVIFDWTTTYFVQKISQIAKDKGFTTISLPHGDMPYVNDLYAKDTLNREYMKKGRFLEIFDYVVFSNYLVYKHKEKDTEKNRIKIIGSPRYSDEWMKIISKMIPYFDVPESKNKLKIVFFLRNTGYPIFWEEVVRTIRLILQFPGIYLIVKHHPRNRSSKKLTRELIKIYPEIKQNIGKNLKFIYSSDVNSASLVKWTDLVIDVGTSVAFGAIKEGKTVLMPEYLHANYSAIAYHIKSSELKCRDELYDTLEKIVKNNKLKLHNDRERENLIKEVINVPDKYVLERYVELLEKCLNE